MSELDSIFKPRNYKESFFQLTHRDQILILVFLWVFPISGLVNTAFQAYEGKDVSILQVLLPCLLGFAIFFVKRWPPYFYRFFRLLPFYFMALFGLLIWRLGDTWSTFDYVLHSVILLFAIVAIVPTVNWYKLANKKINEGLKKAI